KRGDPLFRIDSRPYRAELDRAEAEVRVAEARLESKQAEYQSAQVASAEGRADRVREAQLRGETKVAEASVEAARKSLELARLNMEFTTMTSPISGTILGPVMQAGNVAVADTTTLATIVSTDPMYVYFDVPEDIVLRLNRLRVAGKLKLEKGKGLPVLVGLPDEGDFPRPGIVDSVNGAVDRGTGTAR